MSPVNVNVDVVAIPKWRAAAVFVLLAVCVGALGLKAGRLQLLLGDDLRGLAENQYLRKVQVAAPRGQITDRKGRTLAVSVQAWSVSARPPLVEDKAGAAKALAPLLGLEVGDVAAKLASGDKFVWLKRRAQPDVADGVRALGIPGVELRPDMRRMWPQKALAGQLLGLVDVDGRATGGVELAFDDALEGRSQSVPALADNHGDRISLGNGLDLDLLDGDDVALTLDLEIQHEAEDALASAVVEHQAKSGWALAMDPKTGAVLAVANYPSFNPNAPDERSMANARNKAFAEAFEPGSIFKIATFAAALEAGVVKPEDRIFCENGRFQLGKHVIHDTHKAEWLTVVEVFSQSSNIGTLKIAQRLGEEPMKAALARYHFGDKPGTGLVDESPGRLPPAGRWGEARLATVSFGHGVLVSALQMVSLAQAVANGGVRQQPYLLDRVVAHDGDVVPTMSRSTSSAALDDGERIMSAATAKTLTEIMKSVEKDGGTGTLAAIPGIEVAGKTGTAEKVDPVTHRYSDELHMSSFVGFAPADDPKIVAIVVLDEPKGASHFGGMVAAPAWRRIVERALVNDGLLAHASLTSMAPPPSAGAKAGEGAHVEDLGDENAKPKSAALSSPAAQLGVVDGALDLRGMTARAALRAAEKAGVDVALEGSGVVVAQQPPPGKPIASGERLRLILGEPAPQSASAPAATTTTTTRTRTTTTTTTSSTPASKHAKATKRAGGPG